MRRVEEEMRKRERVEEEKRKAEEIKEKEQEKEQLGELEIEKDKKYVNQIRIEVLALHFNTKYNFCRITELEFAKLAEQLNSRLQVDPAHESVDLDNLFAFLSDVQSGGRSVDNVGDRMKEIVSDFDEVNCTQHFLLVTSYIMWFKL